jgi:hypothetical protein
MGQIKNMKLVNWQDCMNVSSLHFRQTEDYFLSYLSEVLKLSLSPGIYGLLPSSDIDLEDMIRVSEQANGSISVEVMFCYAVTASGIVIKYNSEVDGYKLSTIIKDPSKESKYNTKVKLWNIILSAEPYNRNPSGELDPMETPPRKPNADFSYSLTVVPTDGSNQRIKGHSLIIGRVQESNEHFELARNYIPACITMSGNDALQSYYQNFYELLQSLTRNSKSILSKIYSSTKDQTLSFNISIISKEILRYSSVIYFDFKNNGLKESPFKTVNSFSSLANTIYVSLSFFKESEKEEILKYFYEWTDITPGAFEELLTGMIDLGYDHENLRPVMLQTERFLTVFSQLWGKLSQLEFIGKHKENIVVSERIQMESKETKTGYTFLD